MITDPAWVNCSSFRILATGVLDAEAFRDTGVAENERG